MYTGIYINNKYLLRKKSILNIKYLKGYVIIPAFFSYTQETKFNEFNQTRKKIFFLIKRSWALLERLNYYNDKGNIQVNEHHERL